MIPKDVIDQIFAASRIEEVIGDFVQLKKAGTNYKGLSPFAEEKTPSFVVSPAKQIWKDFSTSKGGNAVSFLMELEHLSYPEALRWLAEKYNIEIPEERPANPQEIIARSERESLIVLSGFAQQTFTQNLFKTQEGKTVGLSYFKERGFRENIIQKFQLGYSLDDKAHFADLAQAKGYKALFLDKTGLSRNKNGQWYDFFRGRVMFPIHNISGKVIAFGGRTLKTDKKVAKYFNSPESDIYHKSNILYGIFFAKNSIVKQDNCFLVEGYTDVISMHQSGVENVVASSGTSLTEGQINLISRYTKSITILYDGDPAGIRASFRGIDMILKAGLNVKVVLFPDGHDPDSYARSVSESALKEYIKQNAKDFLVFKSEVLSKEANNDPIKKAKLIHEILVTIATIPDQITRSVYIRECSEIFDMAERTLLLEVDKIRRKQWEENNKAPAQRPQETALPVSGQPAQQIKESESSNFAKNLTDLQLQEQDLVRLLLNYGQFVVELDPITPAKNKQFEEKTEISVIEFIVNELHKDEMTFTFPEFQFILNRFHEGLKEGVFVDPKEFSHHEDQKITKIAVDLTTSNHELSPRWRKDHYIFTSLEEEKISAVIPHTVYSFKLKKVMQMILDIQEGLKKAADEVQLMALLHENALLNEIKKELSLKLGRTIIK